MEYFFGSESVKNLKLIRPELVAVAKLALQRSEISFCITEGIRTIEKQKEYVRTGKSKTLKSRHLTGHAIDVAAIKDGKIC